MDNNVIIDIEKIAKIYEMGTQKVFALREVSLKNYQERICRDNGAFRVPGNPLS